MQAGRERPSSRSILEDCKERSRRVAKKQSIMGVEALPGKKTYGSIPVAVLASGAAVAIPVHIMKGLEDGPTLCVTSTLHGGEAFTIEIVREVVSRIDSRALHGTVVAVPVANPVAFDAGTRTTPTDGLDLNRLFVEDVRSRVTGVEGTKLTERMAAALAEVIAASDCVLDYHCGMSGMVINYGYVPDRPGELGERAKGIGLSYGLKVMYLGPGYGGSVSSYALSLGIPAVVFEIGGELDIDPKYMEAAVQGVFNVMRHLGMLEGEPELPEIQFLLKERAIIKSRNGGLLHTEVGLDRLNEVIPKGDVIGRVVSATTFEELETIRAPYEKTVTFMLRSRHVVVPPGGYVCFVGSVGTAEIFTR